MQQTQTNNFLIEATNVILILTIKGWYWLYKVQIVWENSNKKNSIIKKKIKSADIGIYYRHIT